MESVLKFLSLFFLLSLSAGAADCVDMDKDFLDYYGAPKESPLIGLAASVSGDKKDKIICLAESCGSGGCECALYSPVDSCMTRVLEFRGSHKVLGEKKDGMSAILVRKKGDPIAPALKKTFIWNRDRRRYVEDAK